MKKIVIAGGAGFIGSNLCRKLINKDTDITVIDNLYTGKLENIKEFADNKNFHYINHNIIKPIDIQADEIYNLACPASPPAYQKDPVYTFKTSVLGIINLLDIATKYNAKILQTSTSEVYGNPYVHPQTEEYTGNVNMLGIRACYDEGKRAAETIMTDYKRKYNTKIKIARIFNTYGPNMDKNDGRVVSNFIMQALQNKDITIYGTGTQTRSFCYIDETVDALVKLMETDETVCGPINIGNPEEYTVKELAEIIIKLTKSNSKTIYKPKAKDDPTKRRPDITKAKSILNWSPEIDIEKGLNKTIEYYKKVIAAENNEK